MKYILSEKKEGIATLVMSRGKVNALNLEMLEEMHGILELLKDDDEVKAVILTGQGKFFSFGFDIPEFLSLSKDVFRQFLDKFTFLYAYIYEYPKATVAALNGHAVAGGCILATSCDYRLMVTGKAKIALNEVTFGASLFAGCIAILKNLVGQRTAEKILFSGTMFSAEEALNMGLIDRVSSEETIVHDAHKVALEFAARHSSAFSSIKKLVRNIDIPEFGPLERKAIDKFIDIWYSEATMKNLKQIKIHA